MPGAVWGRKLRDGEVCVVGDEHKSDLTLS